MDVSVLKDRTQVTVINNEKVYNLLSMANHRAEMKKKQTSGIKNGTNQG